MHTCILYVPKAAATESVSGAAMTIERSYRCACVAIERKFALCTGTAYVHLCVTYIHTYIWCDEHTNTQHAYIQINAITNANNNSIGFSSVKLEIFSSLFVTTTAIEIWLLCVAMKNDYVFHFIAKSIAYHVPFKPKRCVRNVRMYVHTYICFHYPPNNSIDPQIHKLTSVHGCLHTYIRTYICTYVCRQHMHSFTVCRHLPRSTTYI